MPVALLGLVLACELLLQLGALFVHGQSRLIPAQWLTGNTRVLALGDSNTYGLYLQAAESWPAQLERLWNSEHQTAPIEVLNLGYPATNSFRVLDNLPALLDKLSPDVVLIMVGFNDFWTPLEKVPEKENSQSILRWIKEHSRVYRLYNIWLRSRIQEGDIQSGYPRDIAQLDLSKRDAYLVKTKEGDEFFLGTLPGEPARNRHALPQDLQTMIALVQQHHAQVYFMTYPSNWGFYPGANKWIRQVAQQKNIPLIDITPLFIARCVNGTVSCSNLMFHDGHATAQGNALVAKTVAEQLQIKR
jgi:lysophospholipase L1-like esterase